MHFSAGGERDRELSLLPVTLRW